MSVDEAMNQGFMDALLSNKGANVPQFLVFGSIW